MLHHPPRSFILLNRQRYVNTDIRLDPRNVPENEKTPACRGVGRRGLTPNPLGYLGGCGEARWPNPPSFYPTAT
jgi:hypothetical protein